MIIDENIYDFKVENEVEIENYINNFALRRYDELADICLGNVKKNKTKILKEFIDNDRTILDKYKENDYKLLKDNIIHTRKMCLNRREIEYHVYTLDYQIKLLNECKSHKEYLLGNFKRRISNDKYVRREFNIDLENDICDYLIENSFKYQDEELWIYS